jgi:hypothetical protein
MGGDTHRCHHMNDPMGVRKPAPPPPPADTHAFTHPRTHHYLRGVPRLFHVSDGPPLRTMHPRPSPPGTEHAGQEWIWAADEEHLPNYLLPRQCPRVGWRPPTTPHPLLDSTTPRVVAVEHVWVSHLQDTHLVVHELDPAGFTLLDAQAGYWVTARDVAVTRTHRVTDCPAELASRDVELRAVGNLWPYLDAAVAHGAEFSGIRLRNARPR